MLPKYVKRVRSKGRDYLYFDTGKRVDGKKVYSRLPDLRSPSFGGSYAAMMGHRNRKAPAELLRVPKLIERYQISPAYRDLSTASKKLYDIYLRRLERLMPVAPVAEITRGDMRKLVDDMAATPGAANAFLSTCSALFGWGKGREYMPANPCDGIDDFKMGEHQPWPDHVLRAALVTKDDTVRLLANLCYYTAQRLGDVLAMSWNDISNDRITVRPEKLRRFNKVLLLPLHSDLRAELAKRPRAGIVICTDARGKPIKGEAARIALKAFAKKMGCDCVPHGLRKNAVIALLEVGCSVAETAAVSGQSLRMVEHYAKARNQEKLAGSAVLQWEKNSAETYKLGKTSS